MSKRERVITNAEFVAGLEHHPLHKWLKQAERFVRTGKGSKAFYKEIERNPALSKIIDTAFRHDITGQVIAQVLEEWAKKK